MDIKAATKKSAAKKPKMAAGSGLEKRRLLDLRLQQLRNKSEALAVESERLLRRLTP